MLSSLRLLAVACLLAGIGQTAGSARADDAKDDLARKAQGVFKTYCYRCHGQGGRAEQGFNVVIDLGKLVEKKYVVPGQPKKSKLFGLLGATMPPDSDPIDKSKTPEPLPQPTDEDIAAVEAWIKAGAPNVPDAAIKRAFITNDQILEAIAADLESLDERIRQYQRYFTITHLAPGNGGLNDDELQAYRGALSKLFNSLSWGPDIQVPRPIDPAKTILRVDLRKFNSKGKKLWETILEHYPYGVTYRSEAARKVYDQTGCKLPYIRADWFVFAASKPPLYHLLLEIPETDRELEKTLGVDVEAGIDQELVARAGFNVSGVSENNRMIERHRSRHGAYWKSYDFANNKDRRNLPANPLGPGKGNLAFQHDGGEIIFTLPNGLQGYMLTNAQGKRIDTGPQAIVKDRDGPEGAVVNGLSCMHCHKFGMIDVNDEIRPLADTPDVFDRKDAERIKALYPPKADFDELLKTDKDRFASAVKQAGAPLAETEPIFTLAREFEKVLDLKRAAAEIGVPADTFKEALSASPRAIKSLLGSLLTSGGTVKRDAFVEAFPTVLGAFDRAGAFLPFAATDGSAGRVSAVGPGVTPATKPAAEKFITNSIGMKLALIPAGTFQMGSDATDTEMSSDEVVSQEKKQKHPVRITKAFYIGVCEVTQDEYTKATGLPNPSYFSATSHGRGKVAGQNTGKFPVDFVSWIDAVEFCNALSAKEGLPPFYKVEYIAGIHVSVPDWGSKGYRLPTEAEWEYSCRAGKPTKYSFGDNPASLGEFAWFEDNADFRTHPVGEKTANAFGLHDMHGNVSEWCWDSYAGSNYGRTPEDDPRGVDAAPARVLRGGDWSRSASFVRSAARHKAWDFERFQSRGFRVARVQSDR